MSVENKYFSVSTAIPYPKVIINNAIVQLTVITNAQDIFVVLESPSIPLVIHTFKGENKVNAGAAPCKVDNHLSQQTKKVTK